MVSPLLVTKTIHLCENIRWLSSGLGLRCCEGLTTDVINGSSCSVNSDEQANFDLEVIAQLCMAAESTSQGQSAVPNGVFSLHCWFSVPDTRGADRSRNPPPSIEAGLTRKVGSFEPVSGVCSMSFLSSHGNWCSALACSTRMAGHANMNFFMAALPERGGVGGWVADQGVRVEPVCARPHLCRCPDFVRIQLYMIHDSGVHRTEICHITSSRARAHACNCRVA